MTQNLFDEFAKGGLDISEVNASIMNDLTNLLEYESRDQDVGSISVELADIVGTLSEGRFVQGFFSLDAIKLDQPIKGLFINAGKHFQDPQFTQKDYENLFTEARQKILASGGSNKNDASLSATPPLGCPFNTEWYLVSY